MLFSYLISRAGQRPVIFLRRWYVDATEKYWSFVAERAAMIDRIFAVKIMLQTLGQPLYGDYSIIGRILGPMFRLGRVLLTLPVFIVYFGVALVLWLWWILVLPYLVYRIIMG
jgi:hypothetical protein